MITWPTLPFIFRRAPRLLAVLLIFSLLIPAPVIAASHHRQPIKAVVPPYLGPTPKPVMGPRLSPAAIPNTNVLDPATIFNNLLVPPPSAAVEADSSFNQQAPGFGIHQTNTTIAEGITLNPENDVCNDFNLRRRWAEPEHRSDMFTDWFAGWGPFAIDDGGYYHANNVVFAHERVVGPGIHYGRDNNAAKISSTQPYAAGYGSPLIAVKPGAEVTVTVKYLIYDYDAGGRDYDWASLGIKPDATGPAAIYVNGYVRGQWATLTHQIKAGRTGKIMVLLQASSPAAVNSNIYFDDVQIEVNGKYKPTCVHDTLAETSVTTATTAIK